MLIKIAFTVAVILGVIVFFRAQRARANPASASASASDDEVESISPRALAFGVLALLALVSLGWFGWHLHTQNRIVSIRVLSDGEVVVYQARRKSISGRQFTTLDGARVALGASDRIEMIEPN